MTGPYDRAMPERPTPDEGPFESLFAPEYFQLLARHHLRMADRHGTPVVFVFVRIDEADDTGDPGAVAEQAAEVVLDAVRSSDVPTRVDERTFAVLLTGDASGAEELVLSRIVEAFARRRRDRSGVPEPALSVGTAVYEPGSGVSVDAIVQAAVRRMSSERP